MISAHAKPILRAAYLGPFTSYLRNFGTQTARAVSGRYVAVAGVGQTPKLGRFPSGVKFPKWMAAAASLNSHRSLHVSTQCLQEEVGQQGHHDTDSDDDVMAGSHDQTSQTVIHYGRGG